MDSDINDGCVCHLWRPLIVRQQLSQRSLCIQIIKPEVYMEVTTYRFKNIGEATEASVDILDQQDVKTITDYVLDIMTDYFGYDGGIKQLYDFDDYVGEIDESEMAIPSRMAHDIASSMFRRFNSFVKTLTVNQLTLVDELCSGCDCEQ